MEPNAAGGQPSQAQRAAQDYYVHPSHRLVATFFLGFVFMSSVHYIANAPKVRASASRLCTILAVRSPSRGRADLEASVQPASEKRRSIWRDEASSESSPPPAPPHSNNIALTLSVSLGLSSAAQFGSLLVFRSGSGDAACAFLVAWAGLAAQAGHVLGLVKLSLDLRKLGVHKWETLLFWAWVVAAVVLMFVSNAISIGRLTPIPEITTDALCFRNHVAATAALTAGINIVLEIYCLSRICWFIVPSFLSFRDKLTAALDVRSFRALSLLAFDLLTVVPAIHYFSVLTDILPFSVGALLILVAFNARSPNLSLGSSITVPSSRIPSSLRTQRSVIDLKPSSAHSVNLVPSGRVSHPFAAEALRDLSPETDDGLLSPIAMQQSSSEGKSRYVSGVSMVSETDSELARSIKGAVVGFAVRDTVGSNTRRPARGRHASVSPIPESPSLRAASSGVASLPPEHRGQQEREPSPPQRASPPARISITVTRARSSPDSSIHLTPRTPERASEQTHGSSGYGPSSSDDANSWQIDSRHTSYDSRRSRSSSGAGVDPPSPISPATDDLSIVYEASHEDSESVPPSRTYRPTFGEEMFVTGGIGTRLSTPPGLPEDVRPANASSGSGSGKTRSRSGSRAGSQPLPRRPSDEEKRSAGNSVPQRPA